MNKALESRRTIVGDLNIYARVSRDTSAGGQRPDVVLVHGLGVSGRYMIPLALRLAHHCRVFVPDLPGFGESSKPPRALNLLEQADLLALWMRANEVNGATLLGHSLGTQVTVNLILRHPALVARAILVGPTIDARRRTVHQQVISLLLDATREPLSLLPLVIRDYLRAGFRLSLQTLRDALADETEEKLSHLNLPTMIVRGERDPVVPQSWAEAATKLIPGSRLVVIPKAAHAVNYSAAQELARLVLEFP